MVTIRDRIPKGWILLGSTLTRRARRRLRIGSGHRWRYIGPTPERVLIAPPDLRVADRQMASDFYHGRYSLAGQTVETGGVSPFLIEGAKLRWMQSLHSFRWLRHMRAAGTDLAAANARSLLGDWVRHSARRIGGPAWEPQIVARRIIAWLQHSTVLLQGADYAFYRAFLKTLAVQIRYLRAMAPDMPADEERLRARIALALAALSLPVSPAALRNATRALSQELEAQILPDGGHVSRNPAALMELLLDLIPLRHTYSNQGQTPPQELIVAVERMLPALRAMRHRDGALARFNGMGVTIHDRIAAILHHDDTGARPLNHAPYTGYHRLAVGDTVVIADVGAAPPFEAARNAQAGCLSFEMSSGRHHFIVNSGMDPRGAEEFKILARATAAHSTAVVGDGSSAATAVPQRLRHWYGSQIVQGPPDVVTKRSDMPGGQGFIARHDGYVERFGLYHERELALSSNGDILDGCDRLFRPRRAQPPADRRDDVTIRFHIHPDIGLFRNRDDLLVLKAADGETWTFECEDVQAHVEESIFFAALGGALRSRQIVLAYRASDVPKIVWRFTRTGAGARRGETR